MRIWLAARALARRALPVALPLLLLLPGHAARAEGCLLAPAKLSDGVMRAFMERPGQLLERYPAGGPAMSGEIVRLAGSDVSALPAIMQLAKDANTAQRVAIGIGLARASAICSRTHPQLEQMIKQAIATGAISDLAAAFAAGLSSLEQTLALSAADTQSAGASIGGSDRPVGGGSLQSPASGGGGGIAATAIGTELLTVTLQGSTFSVKGDGVPATSLRSRDTLTFTDRGVTSTSGSSISPTRR